MKTKTQAVTRQMCTEEVADSSQIYYGMSGGIIAHADGITFGQPLGDTMVLVKAPGADNVKIENQTGIHPNSRCYCQSNI